MDAVRHLEPGSRQSSQHQADVVDDVLFMRAQGLMDSPGTCCARMNDFDWVSSLYVQDLGLAERDVDVGAPDVGRKVTEVPVVLSELADVTVLTLLWSRCFPDLSGVLVGGNEDGATS